ncbi:hypothetical protein NDI37_14300 [Funiculus sociatus GB2-A5]|jgi:hypothetical protein|uniref:NADH dehydrogenase subunit 1 n=1 Tax=Funiculus sociatus GB2-A5 TaxID=2933946 RepID=A0ABV0JQB8_9CYAN|nr:MULTISPECIES: hypothetical protein [unclassified Trichocoleus]MBD1905554.1 hypothetical protein [Trichocoleus sp. FACHB-832]MBD2062281.1 hypothetical protein [Trichocoleus sp. FACHB-6]
MELLGFLLFGGYVYGGWRFWKGFRRTNFSQGRLVLALLWPVLVIGNKSYRQNYRKALKG